MPSFDQGLEQVIELLLLSEINLKFRRFVNGSPGGNQH